MSAVESNPFIVNPYKPEQHSVLETGRAPITLIDNLFRMGHAYLDKDEEALIDTAGKVASAVDLALSTIIYTSQGLSLAEALGKKYLPFHVPWIKLPWLAKIATAPLGGVFGFLSIVEGFYETTNFARCYQMLSQLDSDNWDLEEVVIDNLNMIKKRFFSLDQVPSDRIMAFIESRFYHLSNEEKAKKFHALSEKALAVKFAELSRRISPSFATETANALGPILQKINSPDPIARAEAIAEGKELLTTIRTQCKKKLLIHAVALVAIGVAILSLLGVFCGFGSVAFFVTLTITAFILATTRYLLENGLLTQKGWSFSPSACLPNCIKNLF